MKHTVDTAKLIRVILVSWAFFFLTGFWAGWVTNNHHNQDREATEKRLADTEIVLRDTLEKLAIARTDRDFYQARYDNGEVPSQIVKVVYRGSLKQTSSDPGPEEAWQEIELTRDTPRDGVIYIGDLWEVADYAQHDAEINQRVMGYVVDEFGSTEESGPSQ
ncbi:hypothetical protein JXA59_03265 [Patescibacteria group bacterium]|nr:hypothetical protein [Patescibacteria group bacterium]